MRSDDGGDTAVSSFALELESPSASSPVVVLMYREVSSQQTVSTTSFVAVGKTNIGLRLSAFEFEMKFD
jgi:hypothetical protein